MDKEMVEQKINDILIENGFFSINDIPIFFMDMTETGLEALELLLSLGDEEISRYLFAHYFVFSGMDSLYKEFLKTSGPKSKKFIKKVLKHLKEAAAFDDIESERLIMSKPTNKDLKEIKKHFKNDGDFFVFCGHKYDKFIADDILGGLREWFNNYSIKLKNGELVGFVALNADSGGIGKLSYYIFKDMRLKGYCAEACKAVINEAFSGKFFTVEEVVENDERIIKRHPICIETIKAKCFTFNQGSNKTLKSLGFTYCGYDYKSERLSNGEWASDNLYYLNKPI